MLPNTTAALAAGAITGRHAAVIADGVKDAPAGAVALIEPEAVAAAAEGDVRATANIMRAFGQALDPDKADAKALRRYERAGVTFSPHARRRVRHHRHRRRDHRRRPHRRHRHRRTADQGDHRTAARRRLDGLHTLAQHWLDTATPDRDTAEPSARRTSRSRARLVVTIDAAGLAGQTSPGGTLTWAGPVTAATAQRLGCDTTATFVHLDPDGNVVEAGTQRRFFTTAQRLAMIARDGDTCATPFCDRPAAWSDAHHLTPVDHGGPTTIANGALPCEGHHL